MLFKRYFWVVNLVAVAMCASFGGRAAAHLVEQVALAPDDSAGAHRASPSPAPERPRTKDPTEVVKRNIFCSSCAPEVVVEKNDGEGGGPAEPQRTTLQLELVSTMVADDPTWSMAVIRDLAGKEKDPGLYGRGSALPGGVASVVLVTRKRVYINNSGRTEYLELDSPPPPGGGPTAAPPPVVAAAGGDPFDAEIGNHVRCNGNNCEVDRSLVEAALANTMALASSARFVPSVRDGKPQGFKVYAIRPSSIIGRIGLQNGDLVKAINGMDMTSPDAALGAYTHLRNASHLTVTVERHGETQTLDYTIR